jgi:hypothetical protein
VLFGGFTDEAAVNLCRDTDHEPAGVGAFRQRLGNRLAGCSQAGEHVTHDIGEARECVNRVGASQDSDGNSATVATCSPSSADHVTR